MSINVLGTHLAYDRRAGFVAEDYRNDRCIVLLQIPLSAASTRVQFLRTYTNIKRITVLRVDTQDNTNRYYRFTTLGGQSWFKTNQIVGKDVGTIWIPSNVNCRWILANYRDAEGKLDQSMTIDVDDGGAITANPNIVITLELELAVWQ